MSAQASSKIIRSKSFLTHPSATEGDTENIPISTRLSISVPISEKIHKWPNDFKQRLTLTGNDLPGSIGSSNAESISDSDVDPVLLNIRDVDDKYYAVTNPAAGHSALVGKDESSELSPENTDKYK